MERLLVVDKQAYASRMQAECRRIMESVMEAVNNAPAGNVISGSEMQVRDLMAEFRQTAFQTAVQMRIDSTESSFSPSAGCQRQAHAEQGPVVSRQPERQRANRVAAKKVARRRPGQ